MNVLFYSLNGFNVMFIPRVHRTFAVCTAHGLAASSPVGIAILRDALVNLRYVFRRLRVRGCVLGVLPILKMFYNNNCSLKL